MDEGENIFVDSKEIMDNLNAYVLATYFIETRKRAKHKSAMAWLENIDQDTLIMLCQYSEKIKDEEEHAKTNTSQDIFDQPMKDEDIEEDEDGLYLQSKTADEGMELYALTVLLLAWEHEQRAVPMEATEPAMENLAVYANMEVLRRQKYIVAQGSGTLLSNNTRFKATAKGKKLGKKIANAIAATQHDQFDEEG